MNEPLTRDQILRSDPEILGGAAVFSGTRVPVAALFDYLKGGDTLDDFLDGFPGVSRAQAVGCLHAAHEALSVEEFEGR